MKIQIVRSLDHLQLAEYVCKQANYLFPDPEPLQTELLHDYIRRADERVFACFAHVPKKYFNVNGTVTFDHLHADQYCMFLYMLSRHCYKTEADAKTATKIYCLNKALHGIEIYYTIELPEAFLFVHPVGTVLGPATFNGFLVLYQNCLIGCLNDQVFPTFEGKTILYAGASVLGHCTVGDNCVFAAYTHVVDANIPANRLVLGSFPEHRILPNDKDFFKRPPFVYE